MGRKTASWLVEKMTSEGHAVALLSGELSIDQRIQVLDRFRDGLEKILITTNVLSRGIDIEQVTIVVNFDLPVDVNGAADCETPTELEEQEDLASMASLLTLDGPKSMAVMKEIERH